MGATRQANLTGLAHALEQIAQVKKGNLNKGISVILRDNGFTNIAVSTIDRFITADTESCDEALARKVMDADNERRKAQNRQRKLTDKIGMEQKANAPLPLANSASSDPLDAYEPRELITNLRKRGYKGELYYTKVYKVTI